MSRIDPALESINPIHLAQPIGFAHGMATRGGRILWLAGQNGMDAEGRIVGPGDIIAQADLALANILAVVEAAGGKPQDVVKLHFYVSDLEAYRNRRRELGQVWKRHFGRWYPAMMLLGVTGFFEADALIEIDGYAVIPDPSETWDEPAARSSAVETRSGKDGAGTGEPEAPEHRP